MITFTLRDGSTIDALPSDIWRTSNWTRADFDGIIHAIRQGFGLTVLAQTEIGGTREVELDAADIVRVVALVYEAER